MMEKSPCCGSEIGVKTIERDPNPEASRGFCETFEIKICLDCEKHLEEF